MGISKSKDIGLYHPHRYMFVGAPSAGKTWLASTFPDPFFFDFDDGCRRIAGAKHSFDFEAFDVLNDPDAARRATSQLRTFISMKSAGKMPYKTCVFDSMTTWSQAQLEQILASNNRQGGKAQIQDYGALAEDMRSFFGMGVRAFDNVIIIAHEETEKDELTGVIVARPLCLGKKFVSFLPSYVEEMWYCESRVMAGKRAFSIKTLPDSRHPFLRTSIPNMPMSMDEPSYPKIAALAGWTQGGGAGTSTTTDVKAGAQAAATKTA